MHTRTEGDPIKLWLDDIRDPHKHGAEGYTWVENVDDAIALLKTGRVTTASLDHDMSLWFAGPTEVTGYDVVVWLEQHPEFWPPQGVRVHSQNPAGRKRMEQVINRHYRSYRRTQ